MHRTTGPKDSPEYFCSQWHAMKTGTYDSNGSQGLWVKKRVVKKQFYTEYDNHFQCGKEVADATGFSKIELVTQMKFF